MWGVGSQCCSNPCIAVPEQPTSVDWRSWGYTHGGFLCDLEICTVQGLHFVERTRYSLPSLESHPACESVGCRARLLRQWWKGSNKDFPAHFPFKQWKIDETHKALQFLQSFIKIPKRLLPLNTVLLTLVLSPQIKIFVLMRTGSQLLSNIRKTRCHSYNYSYSRHHWIYTKHFSITMWQQNRMA